MTPTMGAVMARYFITQIMYGVGGLTYDAVITARPDLAEYIDAYIVENGLEDKIIGFVKEEEPVTEEPIVGEV